MYEECQSANKYLLKAYQMQSCFGEYYSFFYDSFASLAPNLKVIKVIKDIIKLHNHKISEVNNKIVVSINSNAMGEKIEKQN